MRGAPPVLPSRLSPVAVASAASRKGLAWVASLLLMFAPAEALAQASVDEGLPLRLSSELKLPSRGEAGARAPVVLTARELRGQPDLKTEATGDVELRSAGVVVRADRLSYEQAEDLAVARGQVRVSRDGNVYTGPELQLRLQQFEGYFIEPTYRFARSEAGGTAQRIDFLDEQRIIATSATYTSCPADGSGGPAWLLSTDSIKLDFAANEGVAQNAVLRFYGVPILAAPVLSFPLNDERKSGWLPPGINLDSKSGLQVAVPYYWNIAPQRDATLTPIMSVKRGLAMNTEFRYLEPQHRGEVDLTLLPNDRITGSSRFALNLAHDATLPGGIESRGRWLRASDDDYWKDFPRDVKSFTPRLLASEFALSRPFGDWSLYARLQLWQVLQDASSLIEAPYEREPQVGTSFARRFENGLQANAEFELNRFVIPTQGSSAARPSGSRLHSIASLAWPLVTPGWTLTPKVMANAARYALDGPLNPTLNSLGQPTDARRTAARLVPGLSLDSAWLLERDTVWFGKPAQQTLEPRLLYANTLYRDQSGLPNFDAAPKDFNFDSIFSENAFSGVDRVSDAHQLTAGLTTRILDATTGAETMRLGLVQRYLFRDQFVTPDGQPLTQRFSDVLLLGSTTLIPQWTLDSSVQYNPDSNRTVRSILGARYSPGPYRTVGATYRLARDLSEQVEVAWQWPIVGPTPDRSRLSSARSDASCNGSWYSVGRFNYSMRDRRITDSVLGLEFDSGCWIARIVAERVSTGRSEATTRLLLQLELVGLSKLGTNPLQVLKDNIPGYRLLREGRVQPDSTNLYE